MGFIVDIFFFPTSQVGCPVPGDALIFWVDYIHSGLELPPIGDPDCFLKFSNTHPRGDVGQEWKNMASHGHMVAGGSVMEVLLRNKIYGAFARMIAAALKSNAYWGLLVDRYSLLGLCIGLRGKPIDKLFKGKKIGDVLEVGPVS